MKKKLLFFTMLAIFTLLLSTAVMAAPSTPAGLKQTDDSSSSFKIEWNATLENDIRYEISVRDYGSTQWIVKEESRMGTGYVLNGLSAGKSYEVRLRAYDTKNKTYSAYTSPLTVVTRPEVTGKIIQTGVTVNSATFTWDRSEGATEYEVYKEYNGVYTLLGTTTSNSYTFRGLNNKTNTIYSVVVKPVRKSPTYKAVEPSTYTWRHHFYRGADIKLIPEKMGTAAIPYHWTYIKEVKISFADAVYHDGYQVEVYNAKGKKMQTINDNSGDAYNISRTSMYKTRARAYVVVNNKKYYGAWSDYTWFANDVQVNAKITKGKMKISWKKQKGAQKYTVYVSTSQKSGYKKVKTTKKSSFTLKKFRGKKIKKHKNYYVYVVASKKVGKKTFKSSNENCLRIYKY